MKKEILDILYKYRIDFSSESTYTDFGIREEDFEDLANEIDLLLNKNENMKHIKKFFDIFKKSSEESQKDYKDRYVKEYSDEKKPKMRGTIDDSNKDTYAFFTKELLDRKKNQKHRSYAHDAYHIKYDGKEELEKLKEKYPVGGKYRNETITSTTLLDSKTLGN